MILIFNFVRNNPHNPAFPPIASKRRGVQAAVIVDVSEFLPYQYPFLGQDTPALCPLSFLQTLARTYLSRSRSASRGIYRGRSILFLLSSHYNVFSYSCGCFDWRERFNFFDLFHVLYFYR